VTEVALEIADTGQSLAFNGPIIGSKSQHYWEDWDREKIAALLHEEGETRLASRYRHCLNEGWTTELWCSYDPMNHPRLHIPYRCMSPICPHCVTYQSNRLAEQWSEYLETLIGGEYVAYTDSEGKQHLVRARLMKWQLGTNVDTSSLSAEELHDYWDWYHRKVQAFLKHLWSLPELWGGADLYEARTIDGERTLGALVCPEIGPRGLKLHGHNVVYGVPIPHPIVKSEWGSFIGVENPNVFLEEIKAPDEIPYALKYPLKLKGFRGKHMEGFLVKVARSLKGRRRVRGFGRLWRGLHKQAPLEAGCPECGSPWALAGWHHGEYVKAVILELGIPIVSERSSISLCNSNMGSLPVTCW
jgi:hypothetical protein